MGVGANDCSDKVELKPPLAVTDDNVSDTSEVRVAGNPQCLPGLGPPVAVTSMPRTHLRNMCDKDLVSCGRGCGTDVV